MRRAARNSVSPFRAGYDAWLKGDGFHKNPYGPMSNEPEAREWRDGWNYADEQLAREGKKDA